MPSADDGFTASIACRGAGHLLSAGSTAGSFCFRKLERLDACLVGRGLRIFEGVVCTSNGDFAFFGLRVFRI